MPDRGGGFSKVLTWILLVIAVAYLVAAGGGGFNGTYITEFRIASVTIALVALGVWLLVAARSPQWRPRSRLLWALLSSVVALVVADVGSAQPRQGFDYIAYAVLLAGVYLLLQRFFGAKFFGQRFGVLTVLLGFGLSALYVLVVLYRWTQFWNLVGRIVTPPLRPDAESLAFGDPNALATVLILLLAGSAAHLGFATRRRRMLVAPLAVLVTIAVFLTGSRSAWLGLFVSGALVGLLWLTQRSHRVVLLSFLRSRAVRLFTLAALVAVAAVGLLFSSSIASRLGEPASDTRTAFAHASVAMFADHPLTGVGPGMWVVDRIRDTQATDVDYYIPHAHNLVLQTLAELGLVGAIAGAVVLAVMLRLVVHGIRSKDPLARRLGWAALFGGVYLVVHQMFDLYANMPALWFCSALTVARLDALVTRDARPMSTRTYLPVGLGMAVAFGAAGLWLAHSESAAVSGDEAVVAANAGDWTAAAGAARVALERDPAMPPYLFTLGLAEAQTGDLASALVHIRASAEIDDYPIAWLDVAELELEQGNHDAARVAVGQAMRLGYQQPQVALGASTIDIALGDRSAAVSALADALLVAPAFASDPYWDDPARHPLFEDALTSALARASPEVGYRLALEGGRPDVAASIVAALPADEREVPDLVVRSWAGDQAAFDTLHSLAMANPLDVDTVIACLRVATRSEMGLLGVTWVCDHAGKPSVPVVVRESPRAICCWPLPGPITAGHFEYLYRRDAPLDQIVAPLPHLYTEQL